MPYTISLNKEQQNDFERILDNELRIQEEDGEELSPLIQLFFPEETKEYYAQKGAEKTK